MKDNKIIKSLECCTSFDCEHCDYEIREEIKTLQCNDNLMKDALDLINRQRAEIELYKDYNDKLMEKLGKCKIAVGITEEERNQLLNHYFIDTEFGNGTPLQRARAEAVKEFAERLCEGRVSNDPVVIAVKYELKEMEGKQG